MLKKYLNVGVIFITLFSFFFYNVKAYQYKNEENAGPVNDLLVEIYDSKEQYEELAGEYEEASLKIYNANNSSYWWPIGSEQVIEINGKIYAKDNPYPTSVTSNYGYREDPFGQGWQFHSGVDISGDVGDGIINVIAAKDGIVVYPTETGTDVCESSTTLSSCGGGYGNYVVIQHSDGNYSLYAHLHAGTVEVVAGDSVEQGQVIAKMGSSGNSTGTHLHFEIREGQNAYSSAIDSLNYISQENPRVVLSGGEFLSWLNSWEGHTPINGSNYVVQNIGDGVRTVGAGITLENNANRFAQYGINIDDYPTGSEISMEIVDQIEMEVISEKRNSIESLLASNSIVLDESQIQALTSQIYNIGNIQGFTSNYQKYGNTKKLYDEWFFRAISKGTQFEKGLTRRRNAEWSLFHLGEYVYNG